MLLRGLRRCYCVACGGAGYDRDWEESYSWEQHYAMMAAEKAECTLTGVWYEHHVVLKRCFDANGVCDGSCDELARFVVRSVFGPSSA